MTNEITLVKTYPEDKEVRLSIVLHAPPSRYKVSACERNTFITITALPLMVFVGIAVLGVAATFNQRVYDLGVCVSPEPHICNVPFKAATLLLCLAFIISWKCSSCLLHDNMPKDKQD